MTVRAITETYDFPSRSRQELYGDDLLVGIHWAGNLTFCAPAMFRLPKAMPWGEFVAGVVNAWAAFDPDFDPAAERAWSLDGEPFTPKHDQTLAGLGVGHKSLVSFRA